MADGANYKVERFGNEQEPIVIIDDFSSDFEALRVSAATQSYQKLGPFYPGIRAQADPSYINERGNVLKDVLINVFECRRGVDLTECAFSIITTKPSDLTPIQSMPHYDGTDGGRLAMLHYLSTSESGGTAFYRHRSTGFETLTDDRFSQYKETLECEIAEQGLPDKAYISGSTALFEMIGRIEAKPNRCILYRGVTLHSGFIPENATFDTDPLKGRLTINTFLSKR